MTRRYTGAEARELRRGVGPFEVSGVVIVNAHPAAAIRCVADINDQTLGPLLAAAPDLAESLAAVEAERDAYRAYYEARQAMYAAQDSDSLAEEFAAQDRAREARERIAALREAAK